MAIPTGTTVESVKEVQTAFAGQHSINKTNERVSNEDLINHILARLAALEAEEGGS